MTKKSPKFFLKSIGIEPTRENMVKFYRCGWTISELRAGENYIEKGFETEVKEFKKTIV